jgi:hypothetical protein
MTHRKTVLPPLFALLGVFAVMACGSSDDSPEGDTSLGALLVDDPAQLSADLIARQDQFLVSEGIPLQLPTAPSFNPVDRYNAFIMLFVTRDLSDASSLLAPDVTFKINGPSEFSFYQTYHGIDGFQQLLTNDINDFASTLMTRTFYVPDGNELNSINRAQFGLQKDGSVTGKANIEMVQYMKFDESARLKEFQIVQDTYSVLRGYYGAVGDLFVTKYTDDDYAVEGYGFPARYNRLLGYVAFKAMTTGNTALLRLLLAPDAVFTMGNDTVTPFAGQFSHPADIEGSVKTFAKDIGTARVSGITAGANKVVVTFDLDAVAYPTGRPYQTIGKLVFQLDAHGHVARCYYYFDQWSARVAHDLSN